MSDRELLTKLLLASKSAMEEEDNDLRPIASRYGFAYSVSPASQLLRDTIKYVETMMKKDQP